MTPRQSLLRATTYGISTAAYLVNAPAGEVVSNMIICNTYQESDRIVLQIMRLLVTVSIVTSTRGCSVAI